MSPVDRYRAVSHPHPILVAAAARGRGRARYLHRLIPHPVPDRARPFFDARTRRLSRASPSARRRLCPQRAAFRGANSCPAAEQGLLADYQLAVRWLRTGLSVAISRSCGHSRNSLSWRHLASARPPARQVGERLIPPLTLPPSGTVARPPPARYVRPFVFMPQCARQHSSVLANGETLFRHDGERPCKSSRASDRTDLPSGTQALPQQQGNPDRLRLWPRQTPRSELRNARPAGALPRPCAPTASSSLARGRPRRAAAYGKKKKEKKRKRKKKKKKKKPPAPTVRAPGRVQQPLLVRDRVGRPARNARHDPPAHPSCCAAEDQWCAFSMSARPADERGVLVIARRTRGARRRARRDRSASRPPGISACLKIPPPGHRTFAATAGDRGDERPESSPVNARQASPSWPLPSLATRSPLLVLPAAPQRRHQQVGAGRGRPRTRPASTLPR